MRNPHDRPHVLFGPISGSGVPEAERAITAMRAGFRLCYGRGLVEDPAARGRVALTLRIGSAGDVVDVSGEAEGRVQQSVLECIKTRASHARFPPHAGDAAEYRFVATLLRESELAVP